MSLMLYANYVTVQCREDECWITCALAAPEQPLVEVAQLVLRPSVAARLLMALGDALTGYVRDGPTLGEPQGIRRPAGRSPLDLHRTQVEHWLYVEHLTYAEIGRRTGVTRQTVGHWVQRHPPTAGDVVPDDPIE